MHYYKFSIADYMAHTSHLTEMEDLAYRRMMDWCYLHEKPLPKDPEKVGQLIRMRTHSDCIEFVLNSFFSLKKNGWVQKRILKQISDFREKSNKASASARQRWNKNKELEENSEDADAMRTHSEGNANHKPLTTNHKPLTKNHNPTKGNGSLPPEINPVSWGEFEQHRKEIRQPLSELARVKAMNTIKDLSFDQQAAVIDKTIQNRWRGLFPEKTNETHNRAHESNHSAVIRRLSERASRESG